MTEVGNQATDGLTDTSAPEREVLLRGPTIGDRQALKLALMELVARHGLDLGRVDKPRVVIGSQRIPVLTHGTAPAAAFGPTLRAVLDAVDGAIAAGPLSDGENATVFGDGEAPARGTAAADAIGVSVEAFARALFHRYRSSPHGFVRATVLPALETKGLYAHRHYRILRHITWRDWAPTPAGTAAKAALEAQLGIGPGLFGGRTVADELRLRSDNPAAMWAAVAAIDSIVDRAWDAVHDFDPG